MYCISTDATDKLNFLLPFAGVINKLISAIRIIAHKYLIDTFGPTVIL